MRRSAIALAMLVGTGCESGTEPIAVEHNDLGVVSIEIERGREGDGSVMDVIGFDEAGAEIARLHLRVGRMMLSPDVGLPEEETTGSELHIRVGDLFTSFATPDLLPHSVPAPAAALGQFVALHAVADAVVREIGITFTEPAPSTADEVAYTDGGCTPLFYPAAQNECGQNPWGSSGYATYFVSGTQMGSRFSMSTPAVCRNSNESIGCGQGGSGMCYYGPCGFSNASFSGSNGGVYPQIFQAYAGGTGWDLGGGNYSPEQWTDQPLQGDVSPGCTCTACGSQAGTPLPYGCSQAFWNGVGCDIYGDENCQRNNVGVCVDVCVYAGYGQGDCYTWCSD